MGSIGLLFRRPDFRKNPARAIFRRLWWRLRWRLDTKPWILRLGTDLSITVPRCGAGALIYYQGYSAPHIAEFVRRFLRPGSVFVDVGAHLGEYTLLAASLVRPGGEVHAFEPAPDVFQMLEQNIRSNQLDGVHSVCSALADREGDMLFDVRQDPSQSSLREEASPGTEAPVRTLRVPILCLDRYWRHQKKKVDLIKIDVEGAEQWVLAGAGSLLELPPDQAPTLILEFAAHNFARFGYTPDDLLAFLRKRGYATWAYLGRDDLEPFPGNRPPPETVDVVAAKDEGALRSALVRRRDVAGR